MQLEVLALFQKELKEGASLIQEMVGKLPDKRSASEIVRALHSMHGAASLLKINSIKTVASILEREANTIGKENYELIKGAVLEFLRVINPVVESGEENLNEALEGIEPELSVLEKKLSSNSSTPPQFSEVPEEKMESDRKQFFTKLKELSQRFKQHLSFCDGNFEDLERVTLLEEIGAEIRDLGKVHGMQIVSEAGRALNLCFFAIRKKLLGWTRGHFDLIVEIVEFLHSLAGESFETAPFWIAKKKSNVETCINIILAISNEATQFIYYDDLRGKAPLPYTEHQQIEDSSESHDVPGLDEKDQRFVALFLTELRDQIKDFESDLLTLESNPEDKKTASKLMRASHSLKGASKAVGFHSLTRLAHSMEDLFSLVQKGEGVLVPHAIDTLLKAVDVLHALSRVEASSLERWLADNKSRIEKALHDLSGAFDHCTQDGATANTLKANPEDVSRIEAGLIETAEKNDRANAQPLTAPQVSSEESRFLRVSLPHINHLMGLAGEFIVEAKSLELFERGLGRIKAKAQKISADITRMKEKGEAGKREQFFAVGDSLISQGKALSLDISNLMLEFERFARVSESLSSKFYQEMVESRMRPFSEGTEFLPRLIRDLCKQLSKKAKLTILGKNTLVDREILEKLEPPLTHLVRNAVDHGLETAKDREAKGKSETGLIRVEATHRDGALVISVFDDGRGIDLDLVKKTIIEKKLVHDSIVEKMEEKEAFKYLFHPGFSTSKEVTEISGRGIGLNVVQSTVEQLGGRVVIKNEGGTLFEMILPLTLSIIRALLVRISDEPYAFPLTKIKKVLYLAREEIFTVEGREYFKDASKNVGLFNGCSILGLKPIQDIADRVPVVVISDGINDYGIQVDCFLGEKEIAIRELDKKIGKVGTVSAGSFMEDGYPLLILDTEGIKASIDKNISESSLSNLNPYKEKKEPGRKKRILIVDDSAIVRRVLSYLLTTEGFEVDQAVDGQDGLKRVKKERYDLLISDIDMPEMTGIELIHKIREEFKEFKLPVILLSYKDESGFSEAMKPLRVSRFFSKSQFQDRIFVEAVRNLVMSNA